MCSYPAEPEGPDLRWKRAAGPPVCDPETLEPEVVPPPGNEEFLFFFFSSAARNLARASSAGGFWFSLMGLGYYLSVAGIRRKVTSDSNQIAPAAYIAGIAKEVSTQQAKKAIVPKAAAIAHKT